MKAISKLFSLLIIFFVATNLAAATGVNPPKQDIDTWLDAYELHGQNNTYKLACEIGQAASEHGWNCDIREGRFENHSTEYINVFYPEHDNAKGYLAYYTWFGPQKLIVEGLDSGIFKYKNFGDDRKATCQIKGMKSCNIIKSYFGDKPTPTDPKPDIASPVEVSNNTFSNDRAVENVTLDNSTVIAASGNNSNSMNTVENSTGTVNVQGNGNIIRQFLFDLSDIKNSTVNFFVNMGN